MTTTSKPSAIEGIDGITYSTDRWDDARRFFKDWGLKAVSDDADCQVWETLNGARVQVRRPDDASLPPPMELGPTMREVTWGVTDAAALAPIARALQGAPGFEDRRTTDGTLVGLDPHGLRVVFQVSAKRAIDMAGVPTNAWGGVRRIDTPSPVYDHAEPVEIGHVVFFTDKLDQMEAFYASLGFITSDRYPGRGVFMRCAPDAGHHDLFLLALPNKGPGVNHVAFTVRDIHEVFGGGLHMSRCGWKTQLGPGRHPISSAFFWYFENPCGGLIEYNADEDHLTAAWKERSFEPGPTVFAEWAIDGGIDGHTRRQPNVQASGKFLTEKK
jgi:catechol 2,3-dioxygenase-like lactoylglutathione lyase family enzyme